MSIAFTILASGFVWLGLCVVVGILAASFNRSGILFFLIALVASPLIGGILLAAMGKQTSHSQTGAPQLQCPKCDTINDPQARYCSGCGVQIVGAKTE